MLQSTNVRDMLSNTLTRDSCASSGLGGSGMALLSCKAFSNSVTEFHKLTFAMCSIHMSVCHLIREHVHVTEFTPEPTRPLLLLCNRWHGRVLAS